MKYYYKKDGKISGPVDVRELVHLADKETLVRAEFGMPEYLPMSQSTVQEEYEVMLMDDYNASHSGSQSERNQPRTQKVAGAVGIAGGIMVLFHFIHVATLVNNDMNTLKSIPVTSFTIIDSSGHVLVGDSLLTPLPKDTLTTAEAMQLINRGER